MMSKSSILATLAAVSLCGSASAVTFWDADIFFLQGNGLYLNAGDSISGTFQLDVDDADSIPDQTGFIPGTHFATSAKIEFLLTDDGIGGSRFLPIADLIDASSAWNETVTIDLGTFNLATDFEVNLLTVVGTTTANLTLLGDINADGRLNYTLKSTDGDFLAIGGKLIVCAEERSNVPDGGSTMALLSLGTIGLAALRRK